MLRPYQRSPRTSGSGCRPPSRAPPGRQSRLPSMAESERRDGPDGRREFDNTRDAARRTRLANERTYLAWWRTGLTSLAVSLATGRVVPTLSHGTAWPYEIVGAGFAVLGVSCIAIAFQREREIERALERGQFATM